MTKKFATRLVQAGRAPTRDYGFVNPPVVRGSTVLYPDCESKDRIGSQWDEQVPTYGLYGSETHFALERAITEIEGGLHCQIVGSGLAACTVPLLSYLKAGDHLLMPDSVYGPTRRFCNRILARYGVETTFYDPMVDEAAARALLRPNTAVLFTESPGSHTFEVQDIPMLARVAHDNGAKLFLDNTWGIHYFQPFAHGVDVSIQALTKYAGGHSDIMLGAITVNTEADWQWLRRNAMDLGQFASADDCWLALRGLRTLKIRLEAQGKAALDLAHWFAARPEVARVLHPALPGCPGHEFFTRDFTGASGLFGVVFKPEFSAEAVVALIDGLKIFGLGDSWGGYESLAIPSTGTVNRSAGTGDYGGEMARFHVGLEELDDLKADLDQALAIMRAS